MKVSAETKRLAQKIREAGFNMFVVGGAVRDAFMGKAAEDIDICTDAPMEVCEQVFDGFVAAHPDAPVFMTRIDGIETEIAFTRSEKSTGSMKDDFTFVHGVSIFDDLVRRDTTINAIAFDIVNGSVIDPCNGIDDIKNGIIRACSDAFMESPERVFRVFRQVVEFGFTVTPDTVAMCRAMVESGATDTVSTEQIFRQGWFKAFKRGKHFAAGIRFLIDSDAIKHFPSIQAMFATPQSPIFHPEGDAMTHSIMATEFAASVGASTIQVMGAFFHDFGKIGFTQIGDSITSVGHDSADAMRFVEQAMDEIGIKESKMRKAIVGMARMHMRRPTTSKGMNRFSRDCDVFGISARDAAIVMVSDHAARGSASKDISDSVIPMVEFIESKVKVDPIIQGRHIIAMGIKPGPVVGQIVRAAKQAQIDGIIVDVESGIEFVKAIIG